MYAGKINFLACSDSPYISGLSWEKIKLPSEFASEKLLEQDRASPFTDEWFRMEKGL